jgi:hypothetical protein
MAMELYKLYPAELHCLFEGEDAVPAVETVAATAGAWAAFVSGLVKQRAAMRLQEAEVARGKAAMQQLIVSVAGMMRVADHRLSGLRAHPV